MDWSVTSMQPETTDRFHRLIGHDHRLFIDALGRRVFDAEQTVVALCLADVRITVSAYVPRTDVDTRSAGRAARWTTSDAPRNRGDVDDRALIVRPRILPAVKMQTSPMMADRSWSSFHQILKMASKRRVSAPARIADEQTSGVISEPSTLADIPAAVLNSGVIACPGCRDIDGLPVLIVTCRATAATLWHRSSVTHLARLLLYCCCSSCCCAAGSSSSTNGSCSPTSQSDCDKEGHVTLIVDTRTAGLNSLDAFAEVLHVIEVSRPGVFHAVYILVDKVTEAVLSQVSLFQTDVLTKVELLSEDELSKFVNLKSLPVELGGGLTFSKSRWLEYQQKLDAFVIDCYEAATRLMAVTDEITRIKTLPSSVYEAKATIERHDRQVRAILEQQLVCRILETGDDSLNQLSSLVADLGSGILFRENVDAAAKLYRQVCHGFQRLVSVAGQRSVKLERCLELRQFEDQASTIINWLCTEGEDMLLRHSTLADNLRTIEAQWADINKFHALAQVHLSASADVLDEAVMLSQLGICDQTTGVREVSRELKHRISSFMTRFTNTRSMVESALQCYRGLDQIYEWALDTMKLIDVVRRQRSLSRADIEQSLAELDRFSFRRSQLVDIRPPSSPPDSSDTSTATRSLERLTERCRLAATRLAETDDHLELCRSALRDALERLIAADLRVSSDGSDALHSSFSDAVPSFNQQRRKTLPNHSSGVAMVTSKRSGLSSSLFSLLVADVGASAVPIQTSPAFDVSDYMIDEALLPRRDSSVSSCSSVDGEAGDDVDRTEDSSATTGLVIGLQEERDRGDDDRGGIRKTGSIPSVIVDTPSRAAQSDDEEKIRNESSFNVDQLFLISSSNTALSEANIAVVEPADIETVNRSASSALLGALPTAYSPRRSSNPAASVCNISMTSSSSMTGSSERSSRRLRQRWKILRKAISMLVDGTGRASGGDVGEEDVALEASPKSACENSIESLPGLYDNTTLTCVVNESAAAVDDEETMRCKYGWMATPSESNETNQAVFVSRDTLSASASEGDLHCVQNEARRKRVLSLVVQELVQTERDYVRALRYVIDNYIPVILCESVPQQLRGKKSVVFENLEKIYDFHSQTFLTKVEKCANSPYQLGRCFLQHEADLYLYALYNKNKPKSDELMSECGTAYFREKQRELNDRMDLSSYLLKPVQRMGKYALLLAQITDECPTTHPDHADLKAALEMIRFQLRHGNDLLAMDCLRSCDVNLQEQGMLLRQAEFVVWNGRKKCLRHLFLFEELVIFSKTRHSPTGHDVYIYKHSMKTSDIGLTETVGDSDDTFELWFRKRTSGSTFTLRAVSGHVCAEWIRDISRLLWKQTMRNRERRMAEMACLGVGNKPSLDLKPSVDNIHDRFVEVPTMHRGVRLRTTLASTSSLASRDHTLRNGNKRPHSLVSVSSSSSSGSGAPSATGLLLGGILRHGYPSAVTASMTSPAGDDGDVTGGTQCAAGVLGTLTTMHESPLEQIVETSVTSNSEQVLEESDVTNSLLHEIDTQLNAIVVMGNQRPGLSPSDVTKTTSDAENLDTTSVTSRTEVDCGMSDEETDEYQLFTSDILMVDDVCGSLQRSSSVVKPCLADINLM